ncbi:MAG: hypothetical protein AAF409_10075 [Pseudomonadota bacterium]
MSDDLQQPANALQGTDTIGRSDTMSILQESGFGFGFCLEALIDRVERGDTVW